MVGFLTPTSLSLLHPTVDETTTDIICIKCKRDDSDTPNEIVLCDTCGIGAPNYSATNMFVCVVYSSTIITVNEYGVRIAVCSNTPYLKQPASCE